MRKFIIVLFCAAALCGCSSSSKNEEVKIGDMYKARAKWTLYNIGGKNVDSTQYTNGLPWMSIMVDALSFNGSTGCNSMSGDVSVSGDKINFSRVVTTRMACEKGDEAGFLKAINTADNYTIENNMLYLKSGSIVLAVFKKTGEVIKNEDGIKKPGE